MSPRPDPTDFLKSLVSRKAAREAEAQLRTVRATLATVRGERNHAHDLLRAVRLAVGDQLPPDLHRTINCAVALESESDIAASRSHGLAQS